MNTPTLSFVPPSQFADILSLPGSATDKVALFATLCRLNTLSMIARAGSGHIGSSFSAMDIVSWLFLQELNREVPTDPTTITDIYFSSKGHDVPGLYAIMIALGIIPYEKSLQLRRLKGLPGHPDVNAIPAVHTNTGSLGTGVSKAHGMILAQRAQGKNVRAYVLTGDGELQEGHFWESLQPAANAKLGQLTVIVDHNKLQSDTYVSDVSDLGDLEAKFRAYGWHVARCNGHDLPTFAAILDTFRGLEDKPKVIIADTLKGRGVSFMEPDAMENPRLYKFHSGAPEQSLYLKALDELLARAKEQLAALGGGDIAVESQERISVPAPSAPQKLVNAYASALVAQADKNPRLFALDADLALDCGLLEFEAKYPERFIECGIAEQDMVSRAGGMALKGLLPIAHSFACFLSSRPNEQIFNNASERRKVGYVGSLAGILPGGPGHSHQCVRDLSSVGGVPGLSLFEPSCEKEVALGLDYLVNDLPGSFYLRLVTVPRDIPYELAADYQIAEGRGTVLIKGSKLAIVGYGPVLLPEAFHAAQLLKERTGVLPTLINLPWLNRVDAEWLDSAIGDANRLVTLDNHLIEGGQGQRLAAALARIGKSRSWSPFGLSDFPPCGRNDEVLAACGLDAESLAQAWSKLL
jgi:transketolase